MEWKKEESECSKNLVQARPESVIADRGNDWTLETRSSFGLLPILRDTRRQNQCDVSRHSVEPYETLQAPVIDGEKLSTAEITKKLQICG